MVATADIGGGEYRSGVPDRAICSVTVTATNLFRYEREIEAQAEAFLAATAANQCPNNR
jgi:hypothetical protein